MSEHERLADDAWKRWGPYVSERAWGTVREDYSPGGDAWDYFPEYREQQVIAAVRTDPQLRDRLYRAVSRS